MFLPARVTRWEAVSSERSPQVKTLVALPGGFAGHGADAGQQLVKGEGLDEIVVGAEVQTLDPVAHGVARGEKEYGRGIPALAGASARP